jgi:hypothetical protein
MNPISPPIPKMFDYPVAWTVALTVIFTAVILGVAGRFDPTGGTLTISLLVTVSFVGVVVFCLFFTVPTDEITSAVVGGLTAAFGAIMAFWLGRDRK